MGQLKVLIEAYYGRKQEKKKDGTFDEVAIPVIEKIVSGYFQPQFHLFIIANL